MSVPAPINVDSLFSVKGMVALVTGGGTGTHRDPCPILKSAQTNNSSIKASA